MLLLELPLELVWLILDNLRERDIYSLVLASKSTYYAFNTLLYQHNVQKYGGEGLIQAAADGQLASVERFLTLGADPGIRVVEINYVARFPFNIYPKDCDFDWLRHVVVVSGLTGVAKAVIKRYPLYHDLILEKDRDKGEEVNAMTALEIALRHGYMGVAQLLLEYDYHDGAIPRADRLAAKSYVNKVTVFRTMKFASERDVTRMIIMGDVETLFMEAVKESRINDAQMLLDHYPIKINDLPVLYWAVETGCTEMVAFLLSRGAWDIAVRSTGVSLLYHAVERHLVSIVELLLQQPIVYTEKRELIDEVGWGNNRQQLLSLLLQGVSTGHLRIMCPSWWFENSMKDDIMIIQIFLAHPGIQTHFYHQSNQSALSTAMYEGREDIIDLLLARSDVNINHQDWFGNTPLSSSIFNRKTRLFNLLLERNDVDLNIKNNNGSSPLALASRSGGYYFNRLLATGRVDVNTRDRRGNTPLFYAAAAGNREVVDILLAHPDIIPYPKNNDEKDSRLLDIGERA